MEIREVGITPVPGAQPAGSDVRSDEVFDRLSTEIEKMSSPSAAGALDWQKVLDLSAEILSTCSKDLLVASYLSMALMKMQGLKGLAMGVHVWRDILTTYWETLFPAKARMRGRRNAIDWWLQKTSSTVTGLSPEQWEKDEIEALFGDLDTIDAFLRDNMEDAPILGPLMSMIGSVLSAKEVKPQEAPPAPQPAETRKAAAAPVPAAPASPAAAGPLPTGDDPEPFIKHAVDAMRTASTLLMERNSTDGLYFRINRIVAWMTITGPPPSHGGRTMIESPDEEIRESLKSMHHTGSWKSLLSACESRIPQYLFWLDLSRYVAEALEQMGQKVVAAEVTGHTVLYVKRLPGIERLTFADGTPFADPETRKWLTGAAGDGASPSGAAGGLMNQVEDEALKAQAMADGGNLAAAIGQLSQALNRATSVRERFLRQVRMCRFLLQNNQQRVSASYFHELLGLIDAYRLGEWEPALAIEAYEVILAGVGSTDRADEKELGRDAFGRLSLLDPAKAMDYA